MTPEIKALAANCKRLAGVYAELHTEYEAKRDAYNRAGDPVDGHDALYALWLRTARCYHDWTATELKLRTVVYDQLGGIEQPGPRASTRAAIDRANALLTHYNGLPDISPEEVAHNKVWADGFNKWKAATTQFQNIARPTGDEALEYVRALREYQNTPYYPVQPVKDRAFSDHCTARTRALESLGFENGLVYFSDMIGEPAELYVPRKPA